MAITNYSELKTAISTWLHRDDLTTIAPDLVTFAENRIYRDLRIRCMETALSSAIASGVIAVPSGYIELKSAYVDGTPVGKLTRKDADFIYKNYPTRASGGRPVFIAREGESFIFGPYPDSAYTIKGIYYKRLPALSDSNTTNWFTTNAADLLLFAALCEAAPFIGNDSRIVVWEGKYNEVKERIKREDRNEAFSGSVLSVSAA